MITTDYAYQSTALRTSRESPAPSATPCRQRNSLLTALPMDDYLRLAPYLRTVVLEAGQVLAAQSGRPDQVYFPVSAVLSLQHAHDDGSISEVASIGREGMFGATLFMDEATALNQALVLQGGPAYRITTDCALREFQRGGAFQSLVLWHLQSLFMQVAQTSTCNRIHTVEQRLCRWLLGIFERGSGGELIATHARLASVMGVRRESVTAAASKLQDEGAVRYRRGRIAVLVPRVLEGRACGCHTVLKQLFERAPHGARTTAGHAPFGERRISVPVPRSDLHARAQLRGTGVAAAL